MEPSRQIPHYFAGDRNDRVFWAYHAGLLAEEAVITVPAAVVAEAWRGGGRQANLSCLLAPCEIDELSFDRAKAVGVLAGLAGHDDIVDVAVVEGALRRRDIVVTSDPTHLAAIAAALPASLTIATV